MPTALWWTLTLARMFLTRQTGPKTYSEAVKTESCLTITETSDKYRELHFSLCRLPQPGQLNGRHHVGIYPMASAKGLWSCWPCENSLCCPLQRPWSSQWPCRDSKYVCLTQSIKEPCTKVFKGSPPPAHALHSGPLHYVPGPCQWLSSQGWLTWWRRDMGSFWLRAKVKAFHLIQKKNHVEVRTRVGERTSGILYNPSSLSLSPAPSGPSHSYHWLSGLVIHHW